MVNQARPVSVCIDVNPACLSVLHCSATMLRVRAFRGGCRGRVAAKIIDVSFNVVQ